MRSITAVGACAVAAVLLPNAVPAADRWESGSNPSLSNDDAPLTTRNELRPGDRQSGHDLEGTPGAPDRDFYIARTQIYHTYEALVRSGTLFWGTGTAFCVPAGGTSVCPRLDHVASDGTTVIRAGEPDGGAINNSNMSSTLRVHLYGNGVTNYLRVQGDTGGSAHTAADQYDIVFRDTTYSVPRFNNTATQSTILIVQNTTDRNVHVDATLIDQAGNLVTIYGADLAPRATWVHPLATAPVAQGKSGSVLVRHDGPYGALDGKAVALEPATGFTFDTAMQPVSQ